MVPLWVTRNGTITPCSSIDDWSAWYSAWGNCGKIGAGTIFMGGDDSRGRSPQSYDTRAAGGQPPDAPPRKILVPAPIKNPGSENHEKDTSPQPRTGDIRISLL